MILFRGREPSYNPSDTCPPHKLLMVNIDEAIDKYGIKSQSMKATILLGYNLIKNYYCKSGKLGKEIIDELTAVEHDRKALTSLIIALSTAIFSVCTKEKKYKKDPLCRIVKKSLALLREIQKIGREEKELVEKDREKIHELIDYYESVKK